MNLFSSQTESKPTMPNWAEGYMRNIIQDAKKAYGKGPYYYKGSTVTPMANQTTDALKGMSRLADANSGANGMGGNLQEIMSNGGFNSGQLQTMGSMRQMADNPFMNSLINGNGLTDDQRLVADKYRTGMNEQFGTDAAYNRVKQDALDASAQSVTAQAARMGRLGGGANQNILARAQGSLAANMDTAEMDKWRARTQAAAGNLANLSGVGVSQQGTAMDRKTGIENSLFNMNQAGLDNMSKAYQTAMQPYQTQRAVGAEYEDLYTRQMQDKLRKFDAKNPFNHLQQYMSLGSGVPTGTVQTSTPSPFQLGAGGLLALSAFA